MKVISGFARNKNLLTLDGMDTRPTIARVKEGIFSSIQFSVPGAKVLDLFAGSGQMGIEALSRGANVCVFVDNNKSAVDIVIQNLKNCGLFEKSRVATMTAQEYLKFGKEEFDIIFLDPPYNNGVLDEILPKVYELLSEGGIIIAESEKTWELKTPIEGLSLVKEYKYSSLKISKFTKE